MKQKKSKLAPSSEMSMVLKSRRKVDLRMNERPSDRTHILAHFGLLSGREETEFGRVRCRAKIDIKWKGQENGRK